MSWLRCAGLNGTDGLKGRRGKRGRHGETGQKGDKGDQGVQGETGQKGDRGDPGLQGPPGQLLANNTGIYAVCSPAYCVLHRRLNSHISSHVLLFVLTQKSSSLKA